MLWVTLSIAVATIVLMRLLLSLQYVIRARNAVKKLPSPPGAHWLMGHTKQDPYGVGLQWLLDTVKVCPRAYVMWNGPIALPVLVHPETIKPLVSSSMHSDKSVLYKIFEDWVGLGLVTSNGARWKRNRHLLAASFHMNVFQTYIPVFHKCTDVFLEKLERMATEKTPVKIKHEFTLCTFDAFLRAVLSHESNVQMRGPLRDGELDILSAFETLSKISQVQKSTVNPLESWTFPFCSMYSEWAKCIQYSRQFANGLIMARQDELEKKIMNGDPLTKPRDFLDTVLIARDADGTGLTVHEIEDEINTFLFGGFAATGPTLAWVLYALAKYPEHQAKVQDEVDDILTGRDSDRITSKDLGRMEYVTLVIKETIRMWNPVTLLSRTLTDSLDVDGVTLLTGTTVAINLYQLHHNPTVWGDDHMEFKPSRFLPENFNKMESFAYMPFSAGPRGCIAQQFALNEMKLMVARFVSRFQVGLVEGEPEPVLCLDLTINPQKELLLSIKKRESI